MRDLNHYFISDTVGPEGESNQFDPIKKASKGFKNECSSSYHSFSQNINNYYVYLNRAEKKDRTREAEAYIKQAAIHCTKQIYGAYSSLRDRMEGVSLKYKKRLEELTRFFTTLHTETKVVSNLQGLFNEWDDFNKRCMKEMNKNLEDDHSSVFIDYTKIGSLLEKLSDNNCHERRVEIFKKVEGEVFKDFADKPSQCENPSFKNQNRCIYELRQTVGLEKANEGTTPFPCSEDLNKTLECCNSPGECKYFPEAWESYKSILSSASSGDEKICQADGSQVRNAKSRFQKQTLKICEESVQRCIATCKEDLNNFKKDFLNCFFIPDFSDKSYSLHSNNACKEQMQQISGDSSKGFSKYAQGLFGIQPQQATLESVLNNNGFAQEGCRKPHTELIRNQNELLAARSEGVWQDVCSDVAKEEEVGDDNKVVSSASEADHEYHRGRRGSSGELSSEGYHRGPGNVGAVSGSAIFSGGQFGSSTAQGQKERNPLDPKYFPKKGEKVSDQGTEEFFGSGDVEGYEEEGYKGPPDPFASLSAKTSDTGGVGSLSNWKNGEFDFEASEEEKEGGKRASPQYGVIRSPAGIEGGFEEDAYRDDGQSDKGGGFFSWIKRPLRSAYKSLFGDPTLSGKTVQEVFNVHGPEVDLLEKQKELFLEWCKIHGCEDW